MTSRPTTHEVHAHAPSADFGMSEDARPGVGPVAAVVARHETRELCACGCGRVPEPAGTGRRPRFATPACRAAAYRRRLAGLDETVPRQPNNHGRRKLASSGEDRA
jgi:hypothetical protein